MYTWKIVEKYMRIYRAIVAIEDKITLKTRRNIFLLLGVSVIGSLFLLIFFDVYTQLLQSLFFLGSGLWVLLFLYELYVRSYYFTDVEDSFSYKKQTRAVPRLSFDVADICISAEGVDFVRGFLYSSYGRELMQRLGITEADVVSFVEAKSHVLVPRTLDYTAFEMSVKGIAFYAIERDVEFKEFLAGYGIIPDLFREAVLWVLEMRLNRKKELQWWSRESLRKIPSIGKHWAVGELPLLSRFSLPINEVPEYTRLEAGGTRFTEVAEDIERALSATHTANVMVAGNNTYAQMEPIFILYRSIEEGRIHPELEQKRMFFLYYDRIFAEAKERHDVEDVLTHLFEELIKAEEVILVIPNFETFLSASEAMHIDLISLMRPYIISPLIQIIALVDTHSYNNMLRQKIAIGELFAVITPEKDTQESLLAFVKAEARKIEEKSQVMYTYPALKELVLHVYRLFNEQEHTVRLSAFMEDVVARAHSQGKMLIDKKDVADILNVKTGMPGSTISDEERSKLLDLETYLRTHIIGQDEALYSVSETLRRSRSGMRDEKRPIGSFLFLGPTGVGKTETAKALAREFFDSEENMIRFDMTEFSTEDALMRMIGDPTTNKAGVLVSKLREKPYGLLLLDEFEKAHRSLHDLFLQVLDEGVFTDAKGELISARNTIIIATSNAGSDLIWKRMEENSEQDIQDEVITTIIERNILRPELINRFDGVIVFHPLHKKQLRSVAEKMLRELANRIKEKGYELSYGNNLIDLLVEMGNDPKFGARPIARAVTERVEGAVARKILEGSLALGDAITISADDIK